MFKLWLALVFQSARLGVEVQSVIALRVLRLAGGGAPGLTEAQLMVTDKMAALAEAQVAAASAVLNRQKPQDRQAGHESVRKASACKQK